MEIFNTLNIAIQRKCIIKLGVKTSSPWYLFVSSDWASPGTGKFPGKENNNPLQYSCLGNPEDREA